MQGYLTGKELSNLFNLYYKFVLHGESDRPSWLDKSMEFGYKMSGYLLTELGVSFECSDGERLLSITKFRNLAKWQILS